MKLTIVERVALLGTLPAQASSTTLKIVRELKEQLSFSEEEHKALSVKTEGNMLLWDKEAEAPDGYEIEIGEKATDIIVAALKKLDKEEKLEERQLSLTEKFYPKD